jgi:hypothetical protein
MKPPMLAGRSHVGVLKIVSMASQTGGVNKSQSASAGARRAQHGLSAAEPFAGALDGFSRGSIIRRSFVSLDHPIGERDELVRHGKPERLGSFEVYDDFEYGRLRDRQIGRLLALEDAADVGAGLLP